MLTLNTEGISGDTPSLQEYGDCGRSERMYEASLSNTDCPYEILYTWLLKAGRLKDKPSLPKLNTRDRSGTGLPDVHDR
jgi:hypothetical protein